ncbi:MAG: nucleoside recognition domain-containing protein [Christensenellaceae bacterium]
MIFPLLFLGAIVFALVRKKKPYDVFAAGVSGAPKLIYSLFPALVSILLLAELASRSGLTEALANLLSPILTPLGIQEELVPLLLIKPLSGSGSLALLSELMECYGADAPVVRAACVIVGSSETTFYISAVYFADVKSVRLGKAVCLSLVVSFLTAIFACWITRVL